MWAVSPAMHYPSTPVSSRYSHLGQNFRPLNSSPLASPSTPESPVAARRRTQYKSRAPSTPINSSSSGSYSNARAIDSSGGSVFGKGGDQAASCSSPVDPQKTFLREKFKARCFERAYKARAKAVKSKRYMSEASSDGFVEGMDEDEDEDDEAIMHDELFRRIMENANRKQKHSFRVSYALDVGSSIDPDVDNVDEWEQELEEYRRSVSDPPPQPSNLTETQTEELDTTDPDDEELEAYAEEYARRAALAEFEDIPEEELFSFSDGEDLEITRHRAPDGDVEMIH